MGSGYDDILSVQLTQNKTLLLVGSLEKDVMSGEVEWCPILHVRPKFDVFTLLDLDQTPAKYLHLSHSCSPAFLDLFQFSISTQIILSSSQVHPHYV